MLLQAFHASRVVFAGSGWNERGCSYGMRADHYHRLSEFSNVGDDPAAPMR
jgi:hypothetical protein